MASCTFVNQNSAHNGAWVDTKSWNYAGSATGYYYTTMITFSTPSLSCKSDNVTFNLAMAKLNANSLTLRYAICSSDANKSSYCNTYGAVSDSYQLATGTVNISGLGTTVTYHNISVNTTALPSEKNTYYLFLWSNSSNATTASGVVIQPQGEYINATSNVNHTISITANHSYSSSVTNPTCTSGGYTTYTCSKCGHSYTGNATSALGHNEVYGGTSGVHTKCSRCGITISSSHSYSTSVQTAATCTTKGTTKYSCSCGYSYTSQDIPATGHKEVYGGTSGVHTKCSTCGVTLSTAHSYSTSVQTAATCTTKGTTKYTCACGYSYTSQNININPNNHTGSVVNGGTAGVHTKYNCCGATVSTSHTYNQDSGVQYSAATCTAKAKNYLRCSCGYNPKSASYVTETGSVNPNNHTGSEVNGGTSGVHSKYSCCGATIKNGSYHSYTIDSGVQYSAATCTAPRYNYKKCSCGYNPQSSSHIVAYGSAKGHSYTSKVTAPTCTAQGYTTYTCSACGNTYKDNYTNATGHNYVGQVTTEPTYTSPGVMTYTCSRCGASYTEPISKKEGGLVYIDNGTSFVAYQVYIDNGSGWDLYIPYIDNGSGWDICV